MNILKKVTGIWRGIYRYDASEGRPDLQPVPFLLTLDQGWLGRFTGTVVDDATLGMPGLGTINGLFSYPAVEFTKQMLVSCVRTPEGRQITLREYLIEHGHACERDVPHRPILYQGKFTDTLHASGTWIIPAGPILLPDGRGFRMREVTGIWTMEKAPWP